MNLDVHLLGATQADGGEVGEVKTADESAQRRIPRDMVECLGEDNGVREGHVAVQHTQGSRVQRVGGQQTGNQVDVPRRAAIWRDVQRQVGDDLFYKRKLVTGHIRIDKKKAGKHTKNLWWQSLQGRGAGLWLHLFDLFGGLERRGGVPSPAASVQSSQSTQVAVAPAQALSAQADLFPAQKSTARAAEVGGLLHIGKLWFLRGFFRRLVDMGVHERLSNACAFCQLAFK